MYRTLTATGLAAALWVGAGCQALAFTPGGPVAGETYQTPTIGYGLTGDVLSPRALNQEYRYNTPILYYAYGDSFLTFFGSNGVSAVDGAFAQFNALTNVSSYSQGLTEFPLNSTRLNYTATALGLVDLKSLTMSLMLEQLGLGVPDRWTWCLRFRNQGNPCSLANNTYGVIQRNIDPVTWTYSSYVDGTQYGFIITENCTGNPEPEADAVEYPVDPTANTYVPVASGPIFLGGFFGGFTRDDVGGIRYELSKRQVFFESNSVNSLLVAQVPPTNIVASNYVELLSLAAVETPTQLASNFPNLTITSSTFLSNGFVTNVTFTNVVVTNFPPYLPAGTAVITTNQVPVFTTNFQPIYSYVFGNVTTPLVYFDGGVLVTNTNEFIFTPTNACGFTILSNLNIPVLVTNTNVSPVVVYTDHTLAIELPNCLAGTSGLYQGVERLTFFRKDFDSLLGQLWTPVTNTYQKTFVTNGTTIVQTFTRTSTAPDFLFTASDQDPNTSVLVRFVPAWVKDPNAPSTAGGPGSINPQPTANTGTPGNIDLTSVNPLFVDSGAAFLNDFTASPLQAWGSFDGTTNAPIVYPDANSLSNLENLLYLQFTVAGPLPNGHVNVPYSFQLTAQGQAPPPYNWSIDLSQGGLPPGSPAFGLGFFNGKITGTPTTVGVYDFAVQLSDSTGRLVERNFSIEIDP